MLQYNPLIMSVINYEIFPDFLAETPEIVGQETPGSAISLCVHTRVIINAYPLFLYMPICMGWLLEVTFLRQRLATFKLL